MGSWEKAVPVTVMELVRDTVMVPDAHWEGVEEREGEYVPEGVRDREGVTETVEEWEAV